MKYIYRIALTVVLLFAQSLLFPQKKGTDQCWMYVGTYTSSGSKGIYVSRFDTKNGSASATELAAEITNPSFLALHPSRPLLYAVTEANQVDGKKGGAVSAFTVDPVGGKLSFLNRVSSVGDGPCYVTVDRSGKFVLVANYGSGSVAVLPIRADGGLQEASKFVQHSGSSVNPARQKGPHAHSINLSLDGRFAVAADLGLDRLLVYRFDSQKGMLEANDPPFASVAAGAGPRHFAFHPGGGFAYVINEIQSTVTAFKYDKDRGVLKETQTISTLPKDFSGNSFTAEVQVHRSGKFLYGSNRGLDTIAVFTIDSSTGTLTPVQQAPTSGKFPRNFGIDPTGQFLVAANQNSSNLVLFRIDLKTGKLTPTEQTLEVFAPVCVKFYVP